MSRRSFFDLYAPNSTRANPIREDDLADILTPDGQHKI